MVFEAVAQLEDLCLFVFKSASQVFDVFDGPGFLAPELVGERMVSLQLSLGSGEFVLDVDVGFTQFDGFSRCVFVLLEQVIVLLFEDVVRLGELQLLSARAPPVFARRPSPLSSSRPFRAALRFLCACLLRLAWS